MSEQGKPIKVSLPDGPELVFQHIPAGDFRMGQRGEASREEPVTRVEVEQFWMAETPVTQAQYQAISKQCGDELAAIEGNKGADPSDFKGDQRPVETVNWHEARVVAKWLTKFMGDKKLLPEGYVVDLPWEEQWEYACRAKSETEYHTGDGETALEAAGWYGGSSKSETQVVGGLEANRWGLHDMHGNVDEWCRDQFDEGSHRLRVPGVPGNESPEGEGARVLRGGSWYDTARVCRSACRDWNRPGDRFRIGGFRLALVPGPGEQEAGGPRQGAEPKAAAVEARDEPEQAQAAGGASSANAAAAMADLNTTFPPRGGGEILNDKQDDDGNKE